MDVKIAVPCGCKRPEFGMGDHDVLGWDGFVLIFRFYWPQ